MKIEEKMVLVRARAGEVKFSFSDSYSFVATAKGVMVPETRALRAVKAMPALLFLDEEEAPKKASSPARGSQPAPATPVRDESKDDEKKDED